jgi:hypothetical protein
MLGRRMAEGGIGVGPSPGQNGRAIDDEIARPDQPTAQSGQHRQDEERFGHRRTGGLTTLALLRGAGNAGPTIRTNLRMAEFEFEFSKHYPRLWRSLRLEESRLLTLALLPVP